MKIGRISASISRKLLIYIGSIFGIKIAYTAYESRLEVSGIDP